jgi:hypothetical protein
MRGLGFAYHRLNKENFNKESGPFIAKACKGSEAKELLFEIAILWSFFLYLLIYLYINLKLKGTYDNEC